MVYMIKTIVMMARFSIDWNRSNRADRRQGRHIQISVKRNNESNNSNLFFLEDLKGGGDKDFNDVVFKAKGLNHHGHESGVFCIDGIGQVKTDFLFDGGAYKGEIGLFSFEGLEHLDKNSDEFRREAIQRVKSNSEQGRVVLSDPGSGAKFTDGKFAGEKSLNGGDYKGKQTFDFKPNDKVAMIYLGNSKFSDVDPNNPPGETYLSTGSADNFEHFKVAKYTKLPEDSNAALNKLNEVLGSAKGIHEMQTA